MPLRMVPLLLLPLLQALQQQPRKKHCWSEQPNYLPAWEAGALQIMEPRQY